jgi:2-oxoglutarate ferredoxin oxidoreductase subunit beta
VRQTTKAIKEAIEKKGFSFVEIISPCPTLFGRRNGLGDGLETMKSYKENSIIKNFADTREVGLGFKGKIICGKFIDSERPSYIDQYNAKMTARIGPSFKTYEGVL